MAKENESREGGGEIFAPPREEESWKVKGIRESKRRRASDQDSAIFSAICWNKFNADFVLDGWSIRVSRSNEKSLSFSFFFLFSPLRDCSSTNYPCLTHSLQMTRTCVSWWVFLCPGRCCVMNFSKKYIHIYFITRPTSLFLHTFAHIRMFPSICTRNFLFRLDRVLHQLHNCSPDSENPSQKNIQHEKLSPIFHEHWIH